MTGYTVHTGSNKKFAAGWEQVFGSRKKTAASAGKAGVKPAATKRAAKAKKKQKKH